MKEKKEKIDLYCFMEKLKNESDRGVVLISAEIIHNYLTNLFEEHLKLNKDLRKDILESPMAPLSNFSNKIKVAYSLGLIDKESYENLENIRKIRNKFAHRIFDASFKNPEIIDLCKKIKIARISVEDPNNYRHLFYDLAYYLVGYLNGRTITLKEKKINNKQ